MRLSAASLDQLPADILRPQYDRAAVKRGVVHLGIGAFHRAHQAVIFDDALNAGDLRWGITGVSLCSPGVRDQMVPQDGLYLVVTGDGGQQRARLVGAVLDVLVAPENPESVIAAIAAPDTLIITLTITEKGYKVDRVSGGLLSDDPDVAHDLASLESPHTAAGFIVAGLARRRLNSLPPVTIISCDNLPGNGELLRNAVLTMAEAHDGDLAEWIKANIAFPATMVDRIVPATTPDDVAVLSGRIGVEDQAMVKTEPFLQWVIEDHFSGPRPDFTHSDVHLTDAIEPWETAKLRLLNGAHSAMAYLGGLAGCDYVHQFVATKQGRDFVEALWDETVTTFTPPPGLGIPAYRRELMARFANPTLQHRLRQIAMDGSQKLPQRLITPLRNRANNELPSPALSLAVAGWMQWQSGRTDDGIEYAIDDPIKQQLERALPCGADALLAALGADLPPTARISVSEQLENLRNGGAEAAVRAAYG